MQMLEFIEELAKKICEIELCVSNLRVLGLLQFQAKGIALHLHCLTLVWNEHVMPLIAIWNGPHHLLNNRYKCRGL